MLHHPQGKQKPPNPNLSEAEMEKLQALQYNTNILQSGAQTIPRLLSACKILEILVCSIWKEEGPQFNLMKEITSRDTYDVYTTNVFESKNRKPITPLNQFIRHLHNFKKTLEDAENTTKTVPHEERLYVAYCTHIYAKCLEMHFKTWPIFEGKKARNKVSKDRPIANETSNNRHRAPPQGSRRCFLALISACKITQSLTAKLKTDSREASHAIKNKIINFPRISTQSVTCADSNPQKMIDELAHYMIHVKYVTDVIVKDASTTTGTLPQEETDSDGEV